MGHDPTLFLTPVPSYLTCAVCHNALEDPSSCHSGHSFCHACITSWLERNAHGRGGSCPVDRRPLSTRMLVPNLPLRELLASLLIRCPNIEPSTEEDREEPPAAKRSRTEGGEGEGAGAAAAEAPVAAPAPAAPHCTWTGPLGDMSRHRLECLAEEVACEWLCGARFRRGRTDAHASECPRAHRTCEHCAQPFQLQRDELDGEGSLTFDAHLGVCPSAPVSCLNDGCAADSLLRCDLPAHAALCAHALVPCPVGCGAHVLRGGLLEHLSGTEVSHVRLLAAHALGEAGRAQAVADETAGQIRGLEHVQLQLGKSLTALVKAELAEMGDEARHEEGAPSAEMVERVQKYVKARSGIMRRQLLLSGGRRERNFPHLPLGMRGSFGHRYDTLDEAELEAEMDDLEDELHGGGVIMHGAGHERALDELQAAREELRAARAAVYEEDEMEESEEEAMEEEEGYDEDEEGEWSSGGEGGGGEWEDGGEFEEEGEEGDEDDVFF